MYTGSLQQLQMIQQVEFAQHECDSEFENLSDSATEQQHSRPLILSMAQGWERLWASIAQRRSLGMTRPRRPRAV